MGMINSFGALGAFLGAWLVGYLNGVTGGPGVSYTFMAIALLASVVLVLLGILLIVIPTVLMITSLAESASAMIDKMGSQSFTIPPPSSRIASLPIVGERLSALWMRASVDLPGLLNNYRSQIGDIAKQFLSILASMGGGLIGFIISFIVSGIMMAWGAAGAISAQRIAIRMDSASGPYAYNWFWNSTYP